jgi:pimeloyl-ACP methyl ester carboxylesterase
VLEGDRLREIGGASVGDLPSARGLLRALSPGDALELALRRGDQVLRLRETVQAFPLEEHAGAHVLLDEVAVRGHRLRAIGIVPEREGPVPCVYFLPGAHWASEEYPLRLEHPVPSLLGALARAGIASFRVERSGMGDSEGPPCTRVGFDDEVAGYRAGLERLVGLDFVDPRRLFLLGHSLGAAVAPLIAGTAALAGVIVYGPSGLRISEGLLGASRRDHERDLAAGRTPASPLEPLLELIRLVVGEGLLPDEAYRRRPDLLGVAPERFAGDEAYRRVATFYHELERTDLASAWRAVAAPVLALHGERDWICTAEDARHIAGLARDATFMQVAGVDHQLSDAPEGEPLHFASTLGDVLVEWIRDRATDATTSA